MTNRRTRRIYRSCRLCWHGLALLAMTVLMPAAHASQAADEFAPPVLTADKHFAAEVEKLASWCDDLHLKAEAAQTRSLVARDPRKLYLPLMPRSTGSLQASASWSLNKTWCKRWAEVRCTQADALFDLAQVAIAAGQPTVAYQLTLDTLRLNPDHEAARRVCGYQLDHNNPPSKDQWFDAYELGKLHSGHVWNDRFGWVRKDNLDRLLAGQRLLGNTWVSAATDAGLHDNIQSGWDIETEHYRIRTDLSIPAAVELGVRLEELHRLWRQVFFGYYAEPVDLAALFKSAKPEPTHPAAPRLEVVYFRNQKEYVSSLKPAIPAIAMTDGLYYAPMRTAYFYAGSPDSQRTMQHEAAHQLFQQSRKVADDVGKKANFWVVEGVALLMESLHRDGDCIVLGGSDDPRVQAAMFHVRKGDFYMPFAQVVQLGMDDLQKHAEIAKLYSQLSAMTHFLMFYDCGRYRPALMTYLKDVYQGSADTGLLAQRCGASYGELDRQYREYMLQPFKPSAQPASKPTE